jgi:hypothetical protein
MKKKGSLSLSINAIVILVLAITMLGLGLAFTKGMFGKLSSKLSVPEPDIPATAEDPIVLPVEELAITKNKQFIFSVNFYNDGFGSDAVRGKLACEADAAAAALSVCSAQQGVPPGEDKGFKFIVGGTDITQSSTRVCTLGFSKATELTCGAGDIAFPPTAVTKQIVVIVR